MEPEAPAPPGLVGQVTPAPLFPGLSFPTCCLRSESDRADDSPDSGASHQRFWSRSRLGPFRSGGTFCSPGPPGIRFLEAGPLCNSPRRPPIQAAGSVRVAPGGRSSRPPLTFAQAPAPHCHTPSRRRHPADSLHECGILLPTLPVGFFLFLKLSSLLGHPLRVGGPRFCSRLPH